jgi:hypothetical protein
VITLVRNRKREARNASQLSGQVRQREPERSTCDVPDAKRRQLAPEGGPVSMPAGEDTRLPPVMRAFTDEEGAEGDIYVGVGYHQPNGKKALLEAIMKKGVVSESVVVALESPMTWTHLRIVAEDSKVKHDKVNSTDELLHATAADKGPLHRIVHALATGERLSGAVKDGVPSDARTQKDLIAPFVACEIIRKLVNPRHSDPLQVQPLGLSARSSGSASRANSLARIPTSNHHLPSTHARTHPR